MEKIILSKSPEETVNIGIEISKNEIKDGDIIFIYGEMGTGKTCISKGIIQGINNAIKDIQSSSYILIKEYEYDKGKIFHIDLYRLEKEEDILTLDLASIFEKENIVIIEWPEKGLGFLQSPTHKFRIELEQLCQNSRKIYYQRL